MSDNEPKEPLDKSLIETLSNSDLQDVGIESAEVLIDSFLRYTAAYAKGEPTWTYDVDPTTLTPGSYYE